MSGYPLQPKDFIQNWPNSELVRLTENLPVPDRLSQNAISFLQQAGLPARIVLEHPEMTHEISFEKLSEGLYPVTDIFESFEEEFDDSEPLNGFWVIGEESFDNGSAYFCIAESTNLVTRYDPEIDEQPVFVNSSIACFASCLLIATKWSETPLLTDWETAIDFLKAEIEHCDPFALIESDNFWTYLIDAIQDAGPGKFPVKIGS